jgi:DNA-binding MarR family transcriptional regulator
MNNGQMNSLHAKNNSAKRIGSFLRTFRGFSAQKWAAIGLHPGQGVILVELGQHCGVSQSDLAKAVNVSQPTMAKALSRMEKSGIIKRKANPADGRASLNFLTQKGRDLLDSFNASWREIEDQLFADMSEQEIAAGLAFVLRLEGNLTKG